MTYPRPKLRSQPCVWRSERHRGASQDTKKAFGGVGVSCFEEEDVINPELPGW